MAAKNNAILEEFTAHKDWKDWGKTGVRPAILTQVKPPATVSTGRDSDKADGRCCRLFFFYSY